MHECWSCGLTREETLGPGGLSIYQPRGVADAVIIMTVVVVWGVGETAYEWYLSLCTFQNPSGVLPCVYDPMAKRPNG